jgi:hypothetical protein
MVLLLGAVLALVVVVGLPLTLMLQRRMWPSDTRAFAGPPPSDVPDHAFVPGACSQFQGGATLGMVRASFPLATLTLDHQWAEVRIRPSGQAWIDRTEVTEVRLRPRRFMGTRVQFHSQSGVYDGVTFLAMPGAAIREALVYFGWPVAAA